MNYFPPYNPFFPIIETPQAARCYITISMLRVLTSSIPLFQLPWPFQLGLTMLRTRGWILFIPFVFPLSFNGTASSQGILLCKSNTGQFAFSITTILTYSSMGEPLSFLHNLTNCTLPFLSPLPNHTLTFYREWLCNKWTLKAIDYLRIKYDQGTCKIILNLAFTFRFTDVDIKF